MVWTSLIARVTSMIRPSPERTSAVVSITSTSGIMGADCRVKSVISKEPASTGSLNTSTSCLMLRSKSKAVRFGATTSWLNSLGKADNASSKFVTD